MDREPSSDFSLLRIGRVTADGALPDLGAGFDHFA
jgi:hypothetical protein